MDTWEGIMQNRDILFVVFIFIVVSSVSVTALDGTPPCLPRGVGGAVCVDNITCLDGYTVTVTDLDTGETYDKITENGWYACAFSANDGDIIRISCNYENETYENTTIVDLSTFMTWLNLSIGEGSMLGYQNETSPQNERTVAIPDRNRNPAYNTEIYDNDIITQTGYAGFNWCLVITFLTITGIVSYFYQNQKIQ